MAEAADFQKDDRDYRRDDRGRDERRGDDRRGDDRRGDDRRGDDRRGDDRRGGDRDYRRDDRRDFRRDGSRDRRGGGGRDFHRGGDDRRDRRGDDRRRRSNSRDDRNRKPSSASLLVRNLSADVRLDDLRHLFDKFGPVRDVYIPQVSYSKPNFVDGIFNQSNIFDIFFRTIAPSSQRALPSSSSRTTEMLMMLVAV